MNRPRVNLCGVWIDNGSMQEAVENVDRLIRDKQRAYVVTPNVDHIVRLQWDKEFRRVYENAALVLADGAPLLWAARYLGTPLMEKISGSDLTPALCEMAAAQGHKIFFLGGREGTAQESKEVLEKRYPGIRIVGVYSPPMGFEKNETECQKILSMLRQTSPNILFVGLGTPKQENWICRNGEQLPVAVSIGIGATFEFMSNRVRRAPVWMQRWGLEWFWRLLMEPGRLWKRYLVDDPKFFWFVWKQKRSQ